MRRLLVTGCGRSGTDFMRLTLRAAGHVVKGESLDAPFKGKHRIEVSWLLAPYTPWPDTYTVHLVRHPLHVIRSRVDRHNFGADRPRGALARRWCPNMPPEDSIDAAAWHWVQWNRLVVADRRLQVEDIGVDTLNGLLIEVGLEATVSDVVTTPRTEPRSPDLTWDQVRHIPGLMAMAEAYGYA